MEEITAGHIQGERVQSLTDHLDGTMRLAEGFGAGMGLGAEAGLLGKIHDEGKDTAAFQDYIHGRKHRRVDHSTAGAKSFWENGHIGWLQLIGGFCVAGHHTGIPDLGSKVDCAGTSTLNGRMKKCIPSIRHPQRYLIDSTCLDVDHLNTFIENRNALDVMILTRMLFSCLVDADFLDTEAFMNNQPVRKNEFSSLKEIAAMFWSRLEEDGYFRPKNALNEKRCEILHTCMRKGEGKQGLYSLTVPTGGGKTISSMAFAMKQAMKWHKERIIYVIPYLSIIEQTADVFRALLGNHAVLESHSQVDYDSLPEEGSEEAGRVAESMKLAAENWDAPVVITTNEQFFESLYANKTSRCRKLHNIANSVIILDEAQMMPVDFLKPCLHVLEQLVHYYGCTVVLCSATQPELGRYLQKNPIQKNPIEIMENVGELFQFFKRVTFDIDGETDYAEIAKKLDECEQVLCIASTKKEAEKIVELLGGEAMYLSTNLCPAHRREIIREMKTRLRDGNPCRVVSTSIISVGVDIDFPVVYLQYTGLDSLIQGAGRCNREGRQSLQKSRAHIFWTKESKKSLFMRKEKQVTDMIRKKYNAEEMTEPSAIRTYFENWYQSNEGNLDYREIEKLAQSLSFAEIGKRFHLIQDSTKSVFIPFDEKARNIKEQLMMGNRSRQLMRAAGAYMINVRYSKAQGQSDFMKLLTQGQIEMFPGDENLAYLVNMEDYDAELGLKIKSEDGVGIMW